MLKLHRCLGSMQRVLHRFQSTNVHSSRWVVPSLEDDLEHFSASLRTPVPICLIGDPHLRRHNEWILNLQDGFIQATKLRLHHALADFRRQHGFGRGISACQIGTNLRMIALNLGYGPLTLINPKLTWTSAETIRMWDDCMSIPRILVKKKRARSVSIVFTDDRGKEQTWNELDVAVSELLQHEMDHLEGVLNIDQPLKDDETESIISLDEYQRSKHHFDQQVDYTIVGTV